MATDLPSQGIAQCTQELNSVHVGDNQGERPVLIVEDDAGVREAMVAFVVGVVTADNRARVPAARLSIDHFWLKPVDPEDMLEVLTDHCGSDTPSSIPA